MKVKMEEMARDICNLNISCEECMSIQRKTGMSQEQYCKALKYAKRAYRKGYRKQEWISVDERLPEIEGTYLAYTLRRTIEIAHFYPYYVNGKPQFDYWITHWMPLPEAPKMKGGAE